MTTRHHAREIALQILYRYDIAGSAVSDSAITIEALSEHFDHFQVPDEIREFVAQLVAGTLQEIAVIDSLIEKHASNWKLSRMALVDRSILRMAVYELKHFPETAPSIVIDEAVELAKQFGTAETPAFINGILDTVKGTVRAD